MNQIHAPYHFVPLSKWVYMPDWAHQISHDVPFKQGLCGKIRYTLTNATELCVGAEQIDRTKERKPALVKWARDPMGKPVIPGSSIKGMLRSVLEVATFGKFGNIDDRHFSYRDISNANTGYQRELSESRAQAYWLRFDTIKNQWTLRKAKHTALFHDEFNAHSQRNILNIAFKQPAEEKYKQWPLSQDPIRFNLEERRIEGTRGRMVNVERAVLTESGKYEGFPVFSGFRPGLRRHIDRRLNFSYLFYDAATEVTPLADQSLVKHLFSNHDEKLVAYLQKNPHARYGIPVFARLKKHTNEILAFGFAKMPRKLFAKSIADTAQQYQKGAGLPEYFDMAELMFGTLRKEAGYSLKSRVFFTDAKCREHKAIEDSAPVILGEPRASYLNAYLEQPNAKEGVLLVTKTVDLSQYGSDSVPSGWKRYPVKDQFRAALDENLKDKFKVQSQLEMMKEGACFDGEIVFHNLTAKELGALLWTVQFGTTAQKGRFFHSLGHGKPLGAGAVQVEVEKLVASANDPDSETKIDVDILVGEFVDHMNSIYPGARLNWEQSPQIRHLLAFAEREDNIGKADQLRYMRLNNTDRNSNEVTYTSSVKGREKLVLPPWKNHSETLPRKETLENVYPDDRGIASFGQGRLKTYVKQRLEAAEADAESTTIIKDELERTAKIVEARKVQEVEQRQEAELAQLPQTEQDIHRVEQQLHSLKSNKTPEADNQRESCNAQLLQIMAQCQAGGVQPEFVQRFYNLCKDTHASAFIPQTKKKKHEKKERDRQLAELVVQYQLMTNVPAP